MQDITIRNASLADAPSILEIYAWYVEHTVITTVRPRPVVVVPTLTKFAHPGTLHWKFTS